MQPDGIFRNVQELKDHLDGLPEDRRIVVFYDASSLKFPCEIKEVSDFAVEMMFPNGMHICVEFRDVGLDSLCRLNQHLQIATDEDIASYFIARLAC